MQVCIVDNDLRLAGCLQQALEEDGSVATHLSSGEAAADFIHRQRSHGAVRMQHVGEEPNRNRGLVVLISKDHSSLRDEHRSRLPAQQL